MVLACGSVSDKFCFIFNTNIKQITGGNDFDAVIHEIVFPVGSSDGSEICFNVTILRDNISETNQFFMLRLRILTPTVFSIADDGGIATVTIIDDDGTVQ